MTPAKLLKSIGGCGPDPVALRWAKRLLDAAPPFRARTLWAGAIKRAARRLRDDPEALAAFGSAWKLGGKVAARRLVRDFGTDPPARVSPEERKQRARASVEAAVKKRARRALSELVRRQERIEALEGEIMRLRAQEKTWSARVRRYRERGVLPKEGA